MCTTSITFLSCTRFNNTSSSRFNDKVKKPKHSYRIENRSFHDLYSLLSKTANNDPYQPMINSFHAFLIRNDPVKII